MKKIILPYKKIHFIGIGGVSMSGLAEMLYNSGYIISGSDKKSSNATERLKNLGIKVFIGHKAEQIEDDFSLVVYTAAVHEDNAERTAALAKNIPTIDRATLIGMIMRDFSYSAAISGSHGKTTTTAMVSEIFLSAGCDPTISIGGHYAAINGNWHIGDSEYFVLEADEYCDSFLKFFPHIGVILNIEEDHPDYFKDLAQIRESFKRFSQNIDSDGLLVINRNIENFSEIIRDIECSVITYGTPDANIYAEQIKFDENGHASFELIHDGKNLGRIHLGVAGHKNVENILAAYAVGTFAKISLDKILEGMKKFKNPKRRFEFKGKRNGITLVDDFAHHPTEISATLASAKKLPNSRIICVFQPHTFSRTKALFDDFASAFTDADEIILMDIFASRETDPGDIHSSQLAEAIKKRGKPAYYMSNFQEALKHLEQNCNDNDLLITMGAGDVYLLGEKWLSTEK